MPISLLGVSMPDERRPARPPPPGASRSQAARAAPPRAPPPMPVNTVADGEMEAGTGPEAGIATEFMQVQTAETTDENLTAEHPGRYELRREFGRGGMSVVYL